MNEHYLEMLSGSSSAEVWAIFVSTVGDASDQALAVVLFASTPDAVSGAFASWEVQDYPGLFHSHVRAHIYAFLLRGDYGLAFESLVRLAASNSHKAQEISKEISSCVIYATSE